MKNAIIANELTELAKQVADGTLTKFVITWEGEEHLTIIHAEGLDGVIVECGASPSKG